jgi:hypothetical protein
MAKLKELIPEKMHISIFSISCGDLLAYLLEKY